MALIKCPECGAEISNHAVHCPKCGCPIAVDDARIVHQNVTQSIERPKPNFTKRHDQDNKRLGAVSALFVATVFLLGFTIRLQSGKVEGGNYSVQEEVHPVVGTWANEAQTLIFNANGTGAIISNSFGSRGEFTWTSNGNVGTYVITHSGFTQHWEWGTNDVFYLTWPSDPRMAPIAHGRVK